MNQNFNFFTFQIYIKTIVDFFYIQFFNFLCFWDKNLKNLDSGLLQAAVLPVLKADSGQVKVQAMKQPNVCLKFRILGGGGHTKNIRRQGFLG